MTGPPSKERSQAPDQGDDRVGAEQGRAGGPGPCARGGPGDESEPGRRARAERVV